MFSIRGADFDKDGWIPELSGDGGWRIMQYMIVVSKPVLSLTDDASTRYLINRIVRLFDGMERLMSKREW